jgi:hypothetical protein
MVRVRVFLFMFLQFSKQTGPGQPAFPVGQIGLANGGFQ